MRKYQNDIINILLLSGILILARILFIALMPGTYSKDLYAWLSVIDDLAVGKNPYTTTSVLNWPPFWMQVLYFIHSVSVHTSISPVRLIQSFLVTGEVITATASYLVLKRYFNIRKPLKILIFGLALNPVCILLSCQHCNFDVFVGLWVLLACAALLDYLVTTSPVSWLMACFSLGIGILTKTVPLILIPLLFIGLRKQKPGTLMFGALLLFTPLLIGMSIIYSLGHQGVIANVLQYRSMSGWYGITGLLSVFGKDDWVAFFKHISPLVIIAAMALAAWGLQKKDTILPHRLIILMLLLLVALPTFGPGYSPPYINWFLPILVIFYAISAKPTRRFLLLGYAVTMITYSVEYAFFNSHGAFMSKFFPSSKMQDFCSFMGAQHTQVLIRLPVFLYFVTLFFLLCRQLFSRAGSPPAGIR